MRDRLRERSVERFDAASRDDPLLSALVGGLTQIVAWGAYILLQYTIHMVQATAAIPFASIHVERVDTLLILLNYAVLLG